MAGYLPVSNAVMTGISGERSTAQTYAETYEYTFKTIDSILLGDVNSDSIVDARDASVILSYYAYTATGGTGSLKEFLDK